jgi:tetratricopeptide (TPR) repeat protein
MDVPEATITNSHYHDFLEMRPPEHDARPCAPARPCETARPAQTVQTGARGVLVAALVVVAATLAAHWAALGADFVFDDRIAIVRGESSIDALWPPSEWMLGTQRPLVQLTLAANHAFGALDPAGYHAFNLAVHALTALLVLLVVVEGARVLRARGAVALEGRRATLVAASAALLWSLHPATTAASTYVVQRAESMAAGFSLVAVLALLRGARAVRPRAWRALAVACVPLALLSKPTAVSLPALLLAVDALVVGGGVGAALRRGRGLHLAAWASLGVLALTGVVQGIFIGTGRMSGGGVGVATGLLPYWLLEVRALGVYAATIVDPSRLSIDHGVAALAPAWTAVVGASVLAALVALLGAARRRWWAVVPAAILLLLAPTSLVPLADPVADQRLYLPLVAATVGIVAAAASFAARSQARAAGAAVLAAVAVACVLEARATATRAASYADPVRLWTEVLERDPSAVRARANRAGLLLERGRDDEAAADLAAVLAAQPGHPTALLNQGILDFKAGRLEDALERLSIAAQALGDDAAVFGALGDVHRALGRPEDAVVDYGRAGLRAPSDARYPILRANCLAEMGELERAAEGYARAAEVARVGSLRASALFNLGNMRFRQERYREAADAYRRALQAWPEHAGAAKWLEEAEAAVAG